MAQDKTTKDRASARDVPLGSDAPAVTAASVGSDAWADAERLQRLSRTQHHTDFYGLGGEIVATLASISDLAATLQDQVTTYGRAHPLYDDTRVVEPADRLASATEALAGLRAVLVMADRYGNEFWSAIGHIGIATAT